LPAPGVERAARHITEIDDVRNVLRADIRNDRLQRQMVSVHVGNRGKAHGRSIVPVSSLRNLTQAACH
jgi:hypothetical protein